LVHELCPEIKENWNVIVNAGSEYHPETFHYPLAGADIVFGKFPKTVALLKGSG
jgi:hypothetical protein